MYTYLQHIQRHKKDVKNCEYCQERKKATDEWVLKSSLFK